MAPTKSSANLARKPPVPSSKKAESAADRQVAELQRQIAAASERCGVGVGFSSSGVDSIAGGAIDWELDACRALLDEEVMRRNFAILTPQFPDRSTVAQAAELEALERDWQLVTESNAGLKSMVAAQLALAAQLDEMPAC